MSMQNPTHNHGMVTSNTDAVFTAFNGQKLKGVLHDYSSEHSTTILVFECGCGIAFNSIGAHWIVRHHDITSMIDKMLKELENMSAERKVLLDLAGQR